MFSTVVGQARLSHRKVFSQFDSSKYDEFQAEIVEAFWTLGGVQGIMSVTGLKKTQAYILVAKFGLLRQKMAKRNHDAVITRQRLNLLHLRRVWGWRPGDDTVVLNNAKAYVATGDFMIGKNSFRKGEEFVQYGLPFGMVREYLLSHGVKWWFAEGKKIPVGGVKNPSANLTIKLKKGG